METVANESLAEELPDSRSERKISILMWSTFLVTTILALPLAALGWEYSSHQPGTARDADFWFLTQSCSMALLGLFTMALPIWKGRNLPKVAKTSLWLFMSFGALSAIVAPIIYLFAPTEWSAFLNIVAGAVQAFATLQIALVAEQSPDSHLKNA